MPHHSTSLLELVDESIHESQPNVFHETILLELTSLTENEVYRLSRIQSKRSNNSRLSAREENNEA